MAMPHRPHNFRALSKPKQLNKADHRHYLPYIPLLVLTLAIMIITPTQRLPRRGVLAYATEMSSSSLLADTNQEREDNHVVDLALNSQLAAAAQAKANDMVTRNYWSHITPDGQQPWVFIDQSGYKYLEAGENLAYGFSTSATTVTGWMNSPPHRENLLNGAFTEVGFGFANSQNFNQSGPETVVVAMYGKPRVLAANSAATIPQDTQLNQSAQNLQATTTQDGAPTPVASAEPTTRSVSRVQMLTGGHAPWTLFAVGLLSGLAITLLLVKHLVGLRHILRSGERFVLHHPLLDTLLISCVALGSFLSQTTGFIR